MANKKDLTASFRQVSTSEGVSLTDKWSKNCKWREVSAKTDEGIDEAFFEIIKLIDNKRETDANNLKKRNNNNGKNKDDKKNKMKRKCLIQ